MPYIGSGLKFGGFVSTIKDTFAGDGSATSFTLSRAVISAFDLEVFVGNVRQNPDVAYTVSGTTLAFTGTPANGEVIYAVHQAGSLSTITPNSNLGSKDYSISGDLSLLVDNTSALSFGADSEIALTHVADTGLLFKNKNTSGNSGIGAVLTFQTGDTDIAANNVLGEIKFQAPDEGTGTDAILIAAGIAAVSEGDFSSSNNATKLSFRTAASEAASEKMSLSSGGNLSFDGNLIMGSATVTEAQAEILDGATLTTDELNILDASAGNTAIASDIATSAGAITSNNFKIKHTLTLNATLSDNAEHADIVVTNNKVLATSVIIASASVDAHINIHTIAAGSFRVRITNKSDGNFADDSTLILNYRIL